MLLMSSAYTDTLWEDFGDFTTHMLKPDVASIMVNAMIAKTIFHKFNYINITTPDGFDVFR